MITVDLSRNTLALPTRKSTRANEAQQDGTIQTEVKLTGILNTYSINKGEDTQGWGTEVYPGKSCASPARASRG